MELWWTQLFTVMVLEHTSILKLQNSWTGKETTKRAIIQRWFTISVSLSILRRLWPDWKHIYIYIKQKEFQKEARCFSSASLVPKLSQSKQSRISASISKSLYWLREAPTHFKSSDSTNLFLCQHVLTALQWQHFKVMDDRWFSKLGSLFFTFPPTLKQLGSPHRTQKSVNSNITKIHRAVETGDTKWLLVT